MERQPIEQIDSFNNYEDEPRPPEHTHLKAFAVVRADFQKFDSPVAADDTFVHSEKYIESTGSRPWVIVEPAEQSSWRDILDKLNGQLYLLHEMSIGVDRELSADLVNRMKVVIRGVEKNYGVEGDLAIYRTKEELLVTSNQSHVTVSMLRRVMESLDEMLESQVEANDTDSRS